MKFLCSACERLVETDSALVLEDRVELSCPKCGAVEPLERDQAQGADENWGQRHPKTPRSQPATDGKRCPKCDHPRDEQARACDQCGLIFELWVEPSEPDIPEPIAALWKKLDANWDDDSLHDQFVMACFEADRLAFAARHYRSRPGGRSKKQLEKLTVLGMQALRAAEVPTRVDPRLFRIVGWTLFVLLCLGMVTFAAAIYFKT